MERLKDLTLISITYKTDGIGQRIPVEAKRTVVCNDVGTSQSEWFNANQQGIQAERQVFLHDEADYEGEERVEIDGIRMSVYRTYPTRDGGIELYLRRDTGS